MRKRQEFVFLRKRGKRLVGERICLDYLETPSGAPRLGITAPSKYGTAPERSRFKRLVREAFRKSISSIPSGMQLNVLPRQRAKGATEEEIRIELLSLIQTISTANSHAQC